MRTQFLVRRLLPALVASYAFVSLTTTAPANAAFYKCISADGSTTYNDSPCAAHESTRLFSKSARALEGLDCRIARNFAFDAVARMRQDDSASEVFQVYGGPESISEDARRLINQVYEFEKNRVISAQQIVELTIDRCQAGLLGNTLSQCKTFPESFIARFGSCVKARQNEQSVQIVPPSPVVTPIPASKDNVDADNKPAMKAAKPDSGDVVQPVLNRDDRIMEHQPDADQIDN